MSLENRISNINETLFLTEVSADEQLAIETCPGFNAALERAEEDAYEWKRCQDCDLSTRTYPAAQTLVIQGKCPKE